MKTGAATAEEAAAIAAAIEQFIRDTAPPAEAETAGMNPWLRAALYEGVGYSADTPAFWS